MVFLVLGVLGGSGVYRLQGVLGDLGAVGVRV